MDHRILKVLLVLTLIISSSDHRPAAVVIAMLNQKDLFQKGSGVTDVLIQM